jgi:hypothetical protein
MEADNTNPLCPVHECHPGSLKAGRASHHRARQRRPSRRSNVPTSLTYVVTCMPLGRRGTGAWIERLPFRRERMF